MRIRNLPSSEGYFIIFGALKRIGTKLTKTFLPPKNPNQINLGLKKLNLGEKLH